MALESGIETLLCSRSSLTFLGLNRPFSVNERRREGLHHRSRLDRRGCLRVCNNCFLFDFCVFVCRGRFRFCFRVAACTGRSVVGASVVLGRRCGFGRFGCFGRRVTANPSSELSESFFCFSFSRFARGGGRFGGCGDDGGSSAEST